MEMGRHETIRNDMQSGTTEFFHPAKKECVVVLTMEDLPVIHPSVVEVKIFTSRIEKFSLGGHSFSP